MHFLRFFSLFLSLHILGYAQVETENLSSCNSASIPSASSHSDFVVEGKFLYLQAEEEGLAYGSRSQITSTAPTGLGVSDEGTISPGYHPGLSLSIGTNEREKNWDFYLRWTYFQQTSTSFLSAQTGKHVWPFWLNNSQTSNAVVPIANSASASWNLHCNVADIEMGSSFSPSEHLSLRPFFSVRGSWIAQKFNATYNSVNFSDLFLIPSITSYNTNHFQGYGLRIGMDSFWDMGVGLSLFVIGSASLLSGYFSLSQQEIMSDGTLRSDIQNANLAIGIPE